MNKFFCHKFCEFSRIEFVVICVIRGEHFFIHVKILPQIKDSKD
jgi:hypothetical protein